MRRRTVLASTMAVFAVTLTGCTGPSASPNPTGSAEQSWGFGHVHGLGVNPSDNRLYVASHMGVFRETKTGFVRVADRSQDTMGFAVTGNDTFLASGHPDLRETDQPMLLGLIESTDAANTWKALSLAGESDFHTLEPAEDRLYGYDSNDGVLKVTQDNQQWANLFRRPGLVDLAVNPDDPGDLLMTDEQGRLSRLNKEYGVDRVPDAPRLVFVDWAHTTLLVGVSPDGTFYRSRDEAATWDKVSQVDGTPEALDVLPGLWHVATDKGVFRSNDEGRSWSPLAAHK